MDSEPRTHRRVALLICDVPADIIRETHGDYTRIFGTLLEESLKPINHTRSAGSFKRLFLKTQFHITDRLTNDIHARAFRCAFTGLP